MMIDMTWVAIRFILIQILQVAIPLFGLMACWIERYAMAPEAAEVE